MAYRQRLTPLGWLGIAAMVVSPILLMFTLPEVFGSAIAGKWQYGVISAVLFAMFIGGVAGLVIGRETFDDARVDGS